jgi:hypothetical protein
LTKDYLDKKREEVGDISACLEGSNLRASLSTFENRSKGAKAQLSLYFL